MDADGFKNSGQKPGIHVPARTIPAPSTVSPQAQAFLSNPPKPTQAAPTSLADKAAWRAYADERNAMLATALSANAERFPAEIVAHRIASTTVHEIMSLGSTRAPAECALLYLHGGGFVFGAGLVTAYMAMPLAHIAQIKTFAVDYRMPPDAPFPAALDDTIAAYRWLLERYDASSIVVAGASAGGGLAASFILKARDLGLPLPGACVLQTPEADLTESGDTFETNDTIDVFLQHRLTDTVTLYADGHDLRDPYLSPLFGDFGKGFPPTLLLSGTRDLFLSNTVLMHRALLRAGIEAELHVWEAMPHGGFFGAPEDGEVLSEQARFIWKRLKAD